MRLIILTALLAAGCGRSREKEPNDHFTQATPLRAGGEVRGTMASAADKDVYRIKVSDEKALLALHVGGIRSMDFVLSFQDSDRLELKRFDETGSGGDEEAVDLGVVRGVYYLVLSNKNPEADNTEQTYTLKTSLTSGVRWESEPNDRALLADVLEPGELMRGHYFPSRNLLSVEDGRSEEDWFLIDVKKSGMFTLNIDVSEVPQIDPVLEIYDANSYMVKQVDAGGKGEPETLKNFGIRGPVRYHLRLRSKTRAANSQVPYEILTELRSYTGESEFEPNDQRLDATPFTRESIEGNISPAGDADWYRVETDTSSRYILRADLSPLAGMDLKLELTDDIGNVLMTVNDRGREKPELLTGFGLSRREYYLVVSEVSGKGKDARRAYTLSKELVHYQAGLEYELNDSSSSAQSLRVGESMDGYIAPKGDVDWFQFNVYQKGMMVLEITGVRNVRYDLTLYDQDHQKIHAEVAPRPGAGLSFEKELEAGTYSVRLGAGHPSQNNVRDKYTMRVRVR